MKEKESPGHSYINDKTRKELQKYLDRIDQNWKK